LLGAPAFIIRQPDFPRFEVQAVCCLEARASAGFLAEIES